MGIWLRGTDRAPISSGCYCISRFHGVVALSPLSAPTVNPPPHYNRVSQAVASGGKPSGSLRHARSSEAQAAAHGHARHLDGAAARGALPGDVRGNAEGRAGRIAATRESGPAKGIK